MLPPFAALVLALVPEEVGITKPDIRAKGMEVTQAFQIYDPTDPGDPDNNSIELVEGAATVVRVYLSVSKGTTAAGAGLAAVSGSLDILKDGEVAMTLLVPDAPVWVVGPGDFASDREDGSSTLNFTLPMGLWPMTSPPFDLVASVDSFDYVSESNEGNNECTLADVELVARCAPELTYVPINYIALDECDPNTLGLPDEDLIEPGVGDDFVFGILPMPDDRSQYHAAPISHMDWDLDIDDAGAWYSSGTLLLDALETQRNSIDPVPDFLYGWFRGNPYAGNGLGRKPGTVAFGNTSDVDSVYVAGCTESSYGKKFQRTYAHELCHNLGQEHPDESGYAATTAEVGFDVEDLLGLGRAKEAGLWDIMQGGQLTADAWVNEETYLDLLASDDLACPGSTLAALDRFMIIGKIAKGVPTITGSLDPVFRFKSVIAPSTLEPAGTCQLVLRAIDGTLLKADVFEVHFDADVEDGEVSDAVFSRTIPGMAGVHAIELYGQGQLLDVVQRTPSKPAVTILSPAQGQVLPAVFPVSWIGTDQDGDALSYIVRYSHDGGVRWTPLDVSPAETQITVDASAIAGTSGTGVIQILATDGLNTTVVGVGGLTVAGNKPAQVHIAEPEPLETLRAGAIVTLRASAFDLEDGVLGGATLAWSSDIDGPLGQGATVPCTLSAGTHRIALVATDSGQLAVAREVVVRVVDLDLVQDPLVGGTVVHFRAFGREPGDLEFFLYSLAGAGPGPCLAVLQGMCIDLLPPIGILGIGASGQDGVAAKTFFLPAGLPPIALATQVVALPDQDDGPSKSNVVVDVIQ